MNVSIVICVHNGEKFISRAIRSCLDQSMSNSDYEVIVVNDGSTDNTHKVLDSFGDRIRIVTLEKNMGLPFACNVGIKQVLSKYVVRVDADDYVHNDMLKIGYMFLSMNHDMDAVAFDYYLVNKKEEHIKRVSSEKEPIACGIIFRKDYLINIGLYDEDFLLWEDEDLRIRFLKEYLITYIQLPLYRYRMHENNSTKDIKNVELYKLKLKKKHNSV